MLLRSWSCTAALAGLLAAHGQVMHLHGGLFTVAEGTTVTIEGPVVWQMAADAAVVNDGTIDLGTEARLEEAPGAPLVGTGTETATRQFNGPFAEEDPGGLGLEMSHTEGIGTAVVTRGHLPRTTVAGESIARWYTVEATAPGTAPLQMALHYDATELNGLDAADLLLHTHIAEGEGYWLPLAGTADAQAHSVTGTSGPPWALITAFPSEMTVQVEEAPRPAAHRAWPSPTTGPVYIQMADGGPVRSVELFSVHGQRLAVRPRVAGATVMVDLGHLAAGPYLLRINGTGLHRLIKE